MPITPELKRVVPEKTSEKEMDLEWENQIEEEEGPAENLEPHTMAFLRGGHIDVPDLTRFNPSKEIEEIRKDIKESPENLQSTNRLLMMDDFKKKLKIFRENLAKAQLDFENLLRGNQDKDLNWLYKETLHILRKYSVQSQEPEFLAAIDKFIASHQNIKDVVLEYKDKFGETWEAKLFEGLFGRLPRGKVAIKMMPVNLYFQIHNRQDYVLANGGIEENSQNTIFGLKSAGASLNYKLPIDQLNGLILIENSGMNLETSEKEALSIHEEEHAIHKFYPSLAMIKYEQSLIDSTSLGGETNFEELVTVAKRHAIWQNLFWEQSAKSEVLAYLKDKRRSLPEIQNKLLSSELYNYYAIEIEDKKNCFLKHIQQYDVSVKTRGGWLLDEQAIVKQFMDALEKRWEIYKLRISKAISVIKDLIQNYTLRYGEEKGRAEVLRLLSQEPLNKWYRLSKLMLS